MISTSQVDQPNLTNSAVAPEQLPPVVIDLGRTKKKLVKALKAGEGDLVNEITEAVATVTSGLGTQLAGKAVLPIVLIYEKRPRKKGLLPFTL